MPVVTVLSQRPGIDAGTGRGSRGSQPAAAAEFAGALTSAVSDRSAGPRSVGADEHRDAASAVGAQSGAPLNDEAVPGAVASDAAVSAASTSAPAPSAAGAAAASLVPESDAAATAAGGIGCESPAGEVTLDGGAAGPVVLGPIGSPGATSSGFALVAAAATSVSVASPATGVAPAPASAPTAPGSLTPGSPTPDPLAPDSVAPAPWASTASGASTSATAGAATAAQRTSAAAATSVAQLMSSAAPVSAAPLRAADLQTELGVVAGAVVGERVAAPSPVDSGASIAATAKLLPPSARALPATDAPGTGAPATDSPATDAPATDARGTTLPAPTVPAPTLPALTLPAPTLPALTLPAPTLPAPPVPAPTVPVPAAPAPLAGQVGRPLFTLAAAGPGEHTMTISITPDDLGPVLVRARISTAGVRMELFAPTELARDALRLILPELRRDLAAGALPASLDLSTRNQPGDADSSGRHGRPAADQNGQGDSLLGGEGRGGQDRARASSPTDPWFRVAPVPTDAAEPGAADALAAAHVGPARGRVDVLA